MGALLSRDQVCCPSGTDIFAFEFDGIFSEGKGIDETCMALLCVLVWRVGLLLLEDNAEDSPFRLYCSEEEI